MKPAYSTRESQRVTELANEYKSKGYEVIMPSSPKDNPKFLRDSAYVPDLVVTSAEENLVIEVKSQNTSRNLDKISEIAELVNSQPGWQFLLVFTNPRNRQSLLGQPSADKAVTLLQKSRALGSNDEAHVEASFLFAWAALEAALHSLPESRKSTRTPTSAWTLVRDAAMDGSISRRDANDLGRLFKIRNSLLHAGDDGSPSVADVARLAEFVEVLLRQAPGK